MWLRILVGIVFIVGLGGCATSKRTMRTEDMQARLNEAEKEIQQKDEEIADLKAEIQSLSSEVKVGRGGRSSGASSEKVSSKYPDIIRVAANPEDVQTALANAGYYKGNVDGKIGQKTKQAIKEFQSANGLNPDGVLGKKTWVKLQTYLKK